MNQTGYPTEELLPLVETLALAWMGYDHSSIPFDKAAQLMDAVTYCIACFQRQQTSALSAGKVAAETAYRLGLEYLTRCRDEAIAVYESMLTEFSDFGLDVLHDTFHTEFPAAVKGCDLQFAPQESNLAFSYPVLKPIPPESGADGMLSYIRCLAAEQRFLRTIQPQYALWVMRSRRQLQGVNLCQAVLTHMTAYLLSKKPAFTPLNQDDIARVEQIIKGKTATDLQALLESLYAAIAARVLPEDESILPYLLLAAGPQARHIKLLAQYHRIAQMVLHAGGL